MPSSLILAVLLQAVCARALPFSLHHALAKRDPDNGSDLSTGATVGIVVAVVVILLVVVAGIVIASKRSNGTFNPSRHGPVELLEHAKNPDASDSDESLAVPPTSSHSSSSAAHAPSTQNFHNAPTYNPPATNEEPPPPRFSVLYPNVPGQTSTQQNGLATIPSQSSEDLASRSTTHEQRAWQS